MQRSAQGAEHAAGHATFIPCNAFQCSSAGAAHRVRATIPYYTVISHAGVKKGANPRMQVKQHICCTMRLADLVQAQTEEHTHATSYAHTTPPI
jgi:hypothetical protein